MWEIIVDIEDKIPNTYRLNFEFILKNAEFKGLTGWGSLPLTEFELRGGTNLRIRKWRTTPYNLVSHFVLSLSFLFSATFGCFLFLLYTVYIFVFFQRRMLFEVIITNTRPNEAKINSRHLLLFLSKCNGQKRRERWITIDCDFVATHRILLL